MRTPLRHSRTLSRIAGCDVWLKFENLQFTAAFKERGALNKLLSLTEQERAKGVIAMSAGNHAQGVAYHAQRLGIPATIIMPLGTPFTKIQHTRDFGARVIVEGDMLADAQCFAEKLCAEEGLTFVHPYDDPRIIAGQGTIALEMLNEAPELDTLILPIGGGGLISGIAIAAKAIKPDVIYCHTRGFEDGPRSDSPANDQTGNALAGTEYEDGGCADGGAPFWSLTSMGDTGNGFLSAIGVIV